jgi:hypothetical protein
VEAVEAHEQDMQRLKNQITSLSEQVAALTPPSKSSVVLSVTNWVTGGATAPNEPGKLVSVSVVDVQDI